MGVVIIQTNVHGFQEAVEKFVTQILLQKKKNYYQTVDSVKKLINVNLDFVLPKAVSIIKKDVMPNVVKTDHSVHPTINVVLVKAVNIKETDVTLDSFLSLTPLCIFSASSFFFLS